MGNINLRHNWLTGKPDEGYRPTDPVREKDPEIPGDSKVIYETEPRKTGPDEEKSQVVFRSGGEILSAVKVRASNVLGQDFIRYRFRGKEFRAMSNIYKYLENERD